MRYYFVSCNTAVYGALEKDDNDDEEQLHSNTQSVNVGDKAVPAPYSFRTFFVYASVVAVIFFPIFLYSSRNHLASTTSGFEKTTANMAIMHNSNQRVFFGDMDEQSKFELFKQFRAKHKKEYATDKIFHSKFEQFKKNLDLYDLRNLKEVKAGTNVVHGITKFSDLSEDDISKRYKGYKRSTKKPKAGKVIHSATTATSVNWADTYTTPVKNQGYCGSCWAFAAVEQIESDSIRTLGYSPTTLRLSEQQIVSCTTTDYACEGGDPLDAYSYVESAGGIESETDYPYTDYYYYFTGRHDGSNLICNADSDDYVVDVTNFYTLPTEEAMAQYLLTTGPIAVCLDAETWSSYTSGIITADSCGTDVDHCVQAVGIQNFDNDTTTSTYWIIRNSWGTDWGLDGYIYVEYGTNACVIDYEPSYVSVANV